MASMYETIMELPLFKGISVDQVSQFLEKTSVEILNFEDGQQMMESGDRVNTLDFVLKGDVRISHFLENLGIIVNEYASEGRVLGATRLFGRNTNYAANVTAVGKVSVMRIPKEQYFNLLNSDKIYVLNLLNFLSAAVQRPVDLLLSLFSIQGIEQRLKGIADLLTSPTSHIISINGNTENLARFCGVSESEFEKWKESEAARNRIKIISEGVIIKDPSLSGI